MCSTIGRAAYNTLPEAAFIYRGTSDASAAVAVSEKMFIVADDENNVLRVYKTGASGLPVFSYDLTQFLDIESEHPEADIEGATMIGDRIYWITSHGRNKDGKIRPNRYRFFATSVKVQNDNVTIRPEGIPCRTLIHSLIKSADSVRLELKRATRFDAVNLTKQQRKNLAPKKDGLNIEGLCASPDGRIIYIGFRNPRPRSKAIVVPLKNAEQIIERAKPPIFGAPILWNLGGLGIRSMEYSHFHKVYFIVAGPHNGEPGFALYRWSGTKSVPPVLVRELCLDESSFNPEALVTFKYSAGLLLLSDDGSLAINVSDASECMEGKMSKDGKCLNKYLTEHKKKYFRAILLEL
jgi:hypothetical protein